jgi:hypothetical protein
MTKVEEEILYFYRDGVSIKDLSENYGISVYHLKKFLANEPAIQPLGYIWRSLFPSRTYENTKT